MKKYLPVILLASALLLQTNLFAQGTWNTLTNNAPDPNGGVMVLLTDGTVMALTGTGSGGYGNTWDLLTPDSHGSYLNGTWTTLPVMEDTRLYCATQVLPDGNVYVAGAEYGTGAGTGEIYNTLTQTWAYINGVPNGWQMYDGNSEVLYDGTVIQGCQISNTQASSGISVDNLMFHEGTNLYDSIAPCFGSHDEASWVKLPDSSILNVDMLTMNSERYIPKLKQWVVDANLPINLYDNTLSEAGPGFLLPNGKVFFLGDSGYTAIYTPSGNASMGSWKKGPLMPIVTGTQLGCPDAPGAMMPNGKILCAFSPAGTYNTPVYFYEFDYTTNTFLQVTSPTGGNTFNTQAYATNILNLPDGTVLLSDQGDNSYYQYTPKGSPIASGKPVINNIIPNCPDFTITGK
ncbi:MAG TPA: hypothetical protein VNY36_08630, partial [Bacteroidia bacterium]|nr:hypothetical protein [Bacteroidia bacterium]